MNTIKLIKKYLNKCWTYLFGSIIIIIILNLIRSIIPALTGTFLAILDNTPLNESELPSFFIPLYENLDFNSKLALTAFLICIVAFIRDTINLFADVLIYSSSEIIGLYAQSDYLENVQNLSYEYLSRVSTGDLIQRSTQDIKKFKSFITDSLIELLNSLAKLIIYGTCMFLIDYRYSLIVLSFVPIYFVSSFIYFKAQNKDYESIENYESELTTKIQENISNIRIVKAFGNENYEMRTFNNKMANLIVPWKRSVTRSSKFWGVSDFLYYFQLLVSLIVSVVFVSKNMITTSAIATLFLYSQNITWPIRNLGRQLVELGKSSISCKRILDIIEKDNEYGNDVDNKPEINGNIEFDNVSFSFDNKKVLENISFKIKSGQSIALVGKTGCGKSTLISLLVRFIDPTSGRIYIDGNDITTINKKHLRDNIGYVLQEPFLYSKTIKENLNVMLPYDDLDSAKRLASIACVDKDIESLTLNYDTLVGEKGVTLSGGQKQRISIARMLAKNHKIIIFDDSLSAVDSATDVAIRQELAKNSNSTKIIITSRILTSSSCDYIIVMDKGHIIDFGTHNELILHEGLYKDIYDIQTYFDKDNG